MIKYAIRADEVRPGYTYVAIKGNNYDGNKFIDLAIKNKAEKIIVDKSCKRKKNVTKVDNPKEYLKKYLVGDYSNKFKKLKLIGVTGTNGKTTSCYIIYQLLNLMGIKTAFIGTIGFYLNNSFKPINNTTPQTLDLYKLLDEALYNNCEYVVLEVSSHALEEERIAGLNLIAGGFTNLTIDHMDFHKNFKNYLKAKLKINKYISIKDNFVINSDDKYSSNFLDKFPNSLTYGLSGNLKILNIKYSKDSTILKYELNKKEYIVKYKMINEYNAYNVLLSIGILYKLGFDINVINKKLFDILPPPGRCETITINKSIAVIDFAHTPDAVEKVIKSYKKITRKKIITVIGCGGDRDKTKRPLMGLIATKYSDFVIFTNDNPRTEDAKEIIRDIISEITTNNYEIIYNRSKAINKAVKMLRKNDCLLVLGKGHESYQIIGNIKNHFSDREEIEKNIN